jgi:carbamoyl-phosphate synthase large subunit
LAATNFLKNCLTEAKSLGFSDEQIARIIQDGSMKKRFTSMREKHRYYPRIQNGGYLRAEFEAKTPYFYSTFEKQAPLSAGEVPTFGRG